jgi:hypothetical protein
MPALGTTPYDDCNYVLNIARSLGNDAIQTLAGNLLANSKPYVQVFLNSGYRYLQRKLANSGYSTFKKTTILAAIPVIGVAGGDPAAQVTLSYTGCNDGVSNFATPTLPADMNWPLRLRERQTSTVQELQPMYPGRNGLISRVQNIWLRDWYWINDTIAFRGATQVNDVELLYTPFLPELLLTTTPVSDVQIIRSENALAAYVLWAYAFSRGSALADKCLLMGDRFLKEMVSSDMSVKQRGNFRRQRYSGRGRSGWGQ